MDREKLLKLCSLFYATHEIPLAVFAEDDDCLLLCPATLETYPFSTTLTALKDTSEPILYYSDKNGLSFGAIHSAETNCLVLLGPSFAAEVDENTTRMIMRDHFIAANQFDSLQTLFHFMPKLSHIRFLSVMSLLQYTVTGDYCEPNQIPVPSTASFSSAALHKQIVDTSYVSTETQGNNVWWISYQNEQTFFQLFDNGDIEGSLQYMNKPGVIVAGTVAKSPLRQHKNVTIILISLLARHAIQAGVSIRTAYQMSDVYIQEIEKTDQVHQVSLILQDAVALYAQKINDVKVPVGLSKMVYQCVQYIGRSLSETITIDDVAAYVGKSNSYVSVTFKKEMGISLGNYITECKVKEAKRLLRHTDKSIADISTYLCFSNQSHFQNVFKKVTGSTPQKYRSSFKV